MKNDERLQILRMVQEGKISPEEATKLLEALEQPGGGSAGPKPTQVRVALRDGDRHVNFSVGIGLARWVLTRGWIRVNIGDDVEENQRLLLEAIENGTVGKVLEVGEGERRLEVWLEP